MGLRAASKGCPELQIPHADGALAGDVGEKALESAPFWGSAIAPNQLYRVAFLH